MTYDAAGNQTAITSAGRSFIYDAENRQTTATVNSVATTYAYDGNGKRVQKTVGSTITNFVYDAQGNLAAEYGGPTNPLTGTTYLTGDHLGSTRLVTSSTGTALQRFDYAPFGEELTTGIDGRVAPYSANQYPTVSPDGTSQKFTSKERDSETGLDYFGARYFSSAQGRFTSPDEFSGGIVDPFTGGQVEQPGPLPYADIFDPQTLNKYGYVRNNPLRYTDPDGHAFGIDDLVGAVGGAAVGIGAEVVKDWATGQHVTPGAIVGAAVGGAIVGEGIVNIPETLGGSVVAAAAVKGAAQGAVSNFVQQGVDNATGNQKGFSGKSLAVSTIMGGATGGLASKLPDVKIPGISSGAGNMKSVAQGVATKIEKGIVSRMSLKTAIKGAVGGQVANTGRTFTQTYATAASTSVCNANTNGACK